MEKKLLWVLFVLITLACSTLVGSPATVTPTAQNLATESPHSQEQPTVVSTLALTPIVEVGTIPATPEIPLATNPQCQNDYLPAVLGAKWIYTPSQTTEQSGVRSSFVYIEIMEAMSDRFTTYVEHSNTTEFTPPAERIEKNSQFDPFTFYFPSELVETPSARYVYWYCMDGGLAEHNAFMVDIPKDIPSGSTWTIDPSLGMNRDPNVYTSFGIETVTVPAGTFEAVKVKEEWSRMSAYHWYAPGIGKVKSHYSPEPIGIETVMELLSYGIPTSGQTPTTESTDTQPPPSSCEPNDLHPDQWDMAEVNLVGALDQFPNCEVHPVKIAIIDTGVDLTRNNKVVTYHSELSDGRISYTKTAVGQDVKDYNGHGTHIAEIIGAEQNDPPGIAGIHPSPELMVYKYSDEWDTWYQSGLEVVRRGLTSEQQVIADFIKDAVDNGARVINLSVGKNYDRGPARVPYIGRLLYGPCYPETTTDFSCEGILEDAIKYAADHNPPVIIVASAGEETDGTLGHDGYTYPAAYARKYPNVIAVASSTFSKTLGKCVITGDYINVAAPGGSDVGCNDDLDDCIFGLGLNNGDAGKEGTSFAAPHVTSVVALMLSANSDLKPIEVRNIIECTATDFTSPSLQPNSLPDKVGILNASEAVRMAMEGTTECP
jgi:hypothetical protein